MAVADSAPLDLTPIFVEGAEPSPGPDGPLDDAGVDECVAIPVEPRTTYVYWAIRASTLEQARAKDGGGTLTLRVLIVQPTWDGPLTSLRSYVVHETTGDLPVRDLPAGCVVRAAVGYASDGTFVPFSHSAALEAPDGTAPGLVGERLVRWTPAGVAPLSPDDADAPSIQRALLRARADPSLTPPA